jgi:hypothetical protein
MACSHVCKFLLPVAVRSRTLSDSGRYCGGNRVGGCTPAARQYRRDFRPPSQPGQRHASLPRGIQVMGRTIRTWTSRY